MVAGPGLFSIHQATIYPFNQQLCATFVWRLALHPDLLARFGIPRQIMTALLMNLK
jgi:hypothetical protein